MTIKGYVLDALQKFWNKLKTTYVTDCDTDDDNLALAASQGKALGDRVDAVVDRVATVEDQNTGKHAYATIMGKQATIYKYGRVVEITFAINYSSEIPIIPSRVTTNVGTIPAGYRPANTCTFPVYHSAYTSIILQCSISPAGAVEVYNFSTTQINSGWIRFRTIYFSE